LADVLEILGDLLRDSAKGHQRLDLPLDQAEKRQVIHQTVEILEGVGFDDERPSALTREDAAFDLALRLQLPQQLKTGDDGLLDGLQRLLRRHIAPVLWNGGQAKNSPTVPGNSVLACGQYSRLIPAVPSAVTHCVTHSQLRERAVQRESAPLDASHRDQSCGLLFTNWRRAIPTASTRFHLLRHDKENSDRMLSQHPWASRGLATWMATRASRLLAADVATCTAVYKTATSLSTAFRRDAFFLL
jgi:hypothetical protein